MMTITPHHEFSSTNCLNWLLEENDPHQETASQSSIVSLDHQISNFFPSITQVMNNNNNNNNYNNKTVVKKLNHNASERDRRKKLNSLYSNLRSLLPPEDQSKKLSIPATVARVLKYIPKLQKEVRRLNQKKESFITKSSMQENHHAATLNDFKNNLQRKRKNNNPSNYSHLAVSAIQVSDREIVVQSSMTKTSNGLFSKAIEGLEKEGFVVLSASCFQSFDGGRVFNNLLLQAQLGCTGAMDAEKLKEEIIAFYEKPYDEHYC